MGGQSETIRIVAAASLLLDRAWPELGLEGGRQRRSASKKALVELVGVARSRGAEILVLLGDVFDRRCVTPSTIAHLRRALEAFPGRVLITPGGTDWYSSDCPYATAEWPDRVHVFRSQELSPCKLTSGVTFWARAQCSPGCLDFDLAGRTPLRQEGNQLLLVQARQADRMSLGERLLARQTHGAGFRHAIARVSPWEDEDLPDVTVTGTVVHPFDEDASSRHAVLLELDHAGNVLVREPLSLGVPPLRPVRIDVSRFTTTSSLLEAVQDLDSTTPARLEGRLQRGVRLPAVASDDRTLPPLDSDSLEYELPHPDAGEQTAVAEFERVLLEMEASDRERHQAIALGLHALDQAKRRNGARKEDTSR